MAGRPTKLTPDVQRKVCEALSAGNTRADAALYAGIALATIKNWITAGRKGRRKEFREFLAAVRKAEADCAVRKVARIELAGKDDWRADAWWLERRRPKAFGKKDTTTVKGTGKGGMIPLGIRFIDDDDDEGERPPDDGT